MPILQIDPGVTSLSLYFKIVKDDGITINSTPVTYSTFPAIYCHIAGAVQGSAISLSALGSANAAFSAGGFYHLGAGEYRLDVTVGAGQNVLFWAEATDIHPFLVGVVDATLISGNVKQVAGQTAVASGTVNFSTLVVTSNLPTNFSSLNINAGTGLLAVDLEGIEGHIIPTESTGGNMAAAFKKLLDIATGSLAFTMASTNQTGDAFSRIGVAGAGLTSLGDTRIANLDATVSSRSTATDMATVLTRLSATRAGYLDNLSGGAVATYAQVAALIFGAPNFTVPQEIVVPSTGTSTVLIQLNIYADDRTLVDADSTPTFSLKNAAGTNLSARLGSVTHISTGKYSVVYTSTSTDTIADPLNFETDYTLGGKATAQIMPSLTVDFIADYFDSTDRSKLVALYDVMPAHRPTVDSTGAMILTTAYDAAKAAASQTSVNAIPTTAAPTAAQNRAEMDSNSTQFVAILTAVNNLNNLSALANLRGPAILEIPDSSSTLFPFTLLIHDEEGHLVDTDATPTLSASNAAGTDRSANLSTVTRAATGVYTFTYSVASNAAEEGLRVKASGAVGGSARYAEIIVAVANYDSITTLAAIKAKTDNLPASPAAVSDIPIPPTAAANATAAAAAILLTPANKISTDSDNAVKLPVTAPSGYGGSGSAPSVDDIDTKLSASHGSGAWGPGAAGSGAYTIIQPVVNAGAVAMQGVTVSMTNGGAIYTAVTDSSGNATFQLDAATWSKSFYYPGFTFPTGTTAAVTTNVTLSAVTGTANTIPAPSTPAMCVVQFYAKGSAGLLPGATVTLRMTAASTGSGTGYYGPVVRTATADGDGLVTIELEKTSQWRAADSTGRHGALITVPDAANYNPPDFFLAS